MQKILKYGFCDGYPCLKTCNTCFQGVHYHIHTIICNKIILFSCDASQLDIKGPVLAIMLWAPLLLFWFSRERGDYCLRVLFWWQTKASEFSASQKWPPTDHNVQCFMDNTGSLKKCHTVKEYLIRYDSSCRFTCRKFLDFHWSKQIVSMLKLS